MTLRSLLVLLAIAAMAFGAYIFLAYRSDLRKAHAALESYDVLDVPTSFGTIETIDRGDGFPVLSIHGTGGGFDQGYAMAAEFGEAGYRVIAPSRFGYLGAPVPAETDAFAQADAFAELLTGLGVDRSVVMGTSAGAITALAFTQKYPDRTAALLLMVPAYYPSELSSPEPWSPLMTSAVRMALRSDFLFWAAQRFLPETTASMVLATDRDLIRSATPAQRTRLDAMITMILPISARVDGLLLDAKNTATPPSIDLSGIRAPTFIASAADDRYRTADSARLLAEGISGANLLITPDGGHVWANRAPEVDAAAAAFLDRALQND